MPRPGSARALRGREAHGRAGSRRPLEDVFESFDETALASASIAQVHAARLKTGEQVVVKVQRPAVSKLVRRDLRVMAWLAPHLVGRIPVAALANPPALVELFAETIVEELDFRMEAANMLDIAAMLHDLDQHRYVVPRPHPTLVTRRVLVMERVYGFNFDDVAGMKHAGIDTEDVVRTAMIAFMEGAIVEGIFHGDLHGGNLFVMADGRTALLDYGIVGRLSDARRNAFLRLMLGATGNDVRTQMAALRDLGALPMDTDLEAVIKDLRPRRDVVDPTTLPGEEMVKEVQRVVKALLGYGAKLPKELMLYVKNMVFLDGAIARSGARPRHPRRGRQHLDGVRPEARRASRARTRRRSDGGGVRHRGREGGLRADPTSTGSRTASSSAPRADPEADARARRGRPRRRRRSRTSPVVRPGDRPLFGRLLRRLDAHLPKRRRLIMVKAGLRGDPCRCAGRVQAVELDERAEHARRTRRPVGGDEPEAGDADDHAPRGVTTSPRSSASTPGCRRTVWRPHSRSSWRAATARIEVGLTLVRREYPTAIGPIDLVCRDGSDAVVAIEVKRRGDIDGVEQLAALHRAPPPRFHAGCGRAACSWPRSSSRRPASSPKGAASAGSRSTTTNSVGMRPTDLRLFCSRQLAPACGCCTAYLVDDAAVVEVRELVARTGPPRRRRQRQSAASRERPHAVAGQSTMVGAMPSSPVVTGVAASVAWIR